jgi:Flp pilus assembly protein CpaB
MGGRFRGCLWLTAGLIVAILAGFIGFMALSSATARRSNQAAAVPEVPVVVAAHAVPVRGLLKAEDLTQKTLPVDAVPEGALRDPGQAVGKVTMADLYTGETVLKQRLVDPKSVSGDGRSAIVMSEDQVLLALPAVDLMSKAGVLKPGDHVDLLFTMGVPTGVARPAPGAGGAATGGGGAGDTNRTTFDTLQNVTISAMVGGSTSTTSTGAAAPPTAPEALLLILTPQDALTLKFMMDEQGSSLTLVLRAPGVDRPFTTEPVDMRYLINRYQLP